MNKPISLSFRSEPIGVAYRQLLRFCLARAAQFLLVVRSTIALTQQGEAVLQSLLPYLVDKTTASQWPGTQLVDGSVATIYFFKLTVESENILLNSVDRLYKWQQPAFPEDLCLLRSDGSTLLATISHERDAFLSLLDDEVSNIATECPELKLSQDS